MRNLRSDIRSLVFKEMILNDCWFLVGKVKFKL